MRQALDPVLPGEPSRVAPAKVLPHLSEDNSIAMPQFDPQLVQLMRSVLEDVMMRVPAEHATPATKAYLAECILKAAAQGHTSYDALIAAAADQIQTILSLFT
jgi:DNA-binding FadR family transcriptional regulator